MNEQQRYEILEGLPPYGPMHVSVSEENEPFYSEGFVVRFYRADGSNWVANFKPGWTSFNLVINTNDPSRIIVIAGGMGYMMHPNKTEPLDTFGIDIREALTTVDNKVVLIDGIGLRVIDTDGSIWESERISWDGIKDVKAEGNLITGLSFDVMDSINSWVAFSINLDDKEIFGGSYRRY